MTYQSVTVPIYKKNTSMTRKETIIQAAAQLFSEKGYRETTTADIRNRAQVAQGTLFYHFNNKEGILLHIFGELINEYMKVIEKFSHDDLTGMEGLEHYAEMIKKLMHDENQTVHLILPHLVPSLLEENEETKKLFLKYVETSTSSLETLIRKGVQDGSIRKVDPEKTAHFLFALTTGMTRYNTMPVGEKKDIAETAWDFIQTALSPIK